MSEEPVSKRDLALARLAQMSQEELQEISDWLDTLDDPMNPEDLTR